jgi:hypothetical protein
VHELAGDENVHSRPDGYVEPVIGKWGRIPVELRDVDKIDALAEGDNKWPILMESVDELGNPRYKLSVSALYWGVKRMANEMLEGCSSLPK